MRDLLHTMSRGLRSAGLVAVGVLALWLLVPEQAHAWVKVCNQTSKTVEYHHNRPDSGCSGQCGSNPHGRWGWYIMAPGQCATVYSDSANGKWFEWFARSTDHTSVWTSGSRSWQFPNAATEGYCDCIGCIFGGGGPCDPVYNHRLMQPTATNWTLNLTP